MIYQLNKFNISNEEIKKGYEIVFQPFLEGYRNHVNELYLEEYNDRSDSFIYMEPIKLFLLLSEDSSYIIITRSERDELVFIPPSPENYAFSENPEKLKIKFMKEQLQIDNPLEYTPYYAFLRYIGGKFFKETNHPKLYEEAKISGISTADSHASQYEYYKSLNMYLSHKVELENIDFENITTKVNDPSFQYEFEESVKAYNAGLYLAAATTGRIALENILRQLIKKELGSQFLPDKTYIWKSVDVLTKNEILSGRLRGQINQQSEIRNTNCHTNDAPVTKETVDNLYGVIRDISNLFT